MNFLKKVCRKLINALTDVLISFSLFIKIIIKSIIYKNKIYIFGIPIHGNLGDQAILYAEEKFLKDNYSQYKIIEVPSKFNSRFLKKIVRNDLIIYTGGGFLGSLWPNEEYLFRSTLKMFSENKIIVFPHTFFFEENQIGEEILNESIEIYSKHKNLHLICREKYSYDFMKKNFSKCNIYLCPDIVLYLNKFNNNDIKNGIAFCLREDKEKVNCNKTDYEDLLFKLGYKKCDNLSTVVNKNIFPMFRKLNIKNKIKEFSKYELIITDRLHGMIFSYLAGTPCIVFQNKSYKIKGVYEWIKNIKSVKLVDDLSENIIKEMLNQNNDDVFDIKKFDIIKNII